MVGEGADQVRQAREACGIGKRVAAQIIGLRSNSMYNKREENPDEFSIGEFFKLYYELDDFARSRLWDYLEEKRAAAP